VLLLLLVLIEDFEDMFIVNEESTAASDTRTDRVNVIVDQKGIFTRTFNLG
jgi:hypothetical protein